VLCSNDRRHSVTAAALLSLGMTMTPPPKAPKTDGPKTNLVDKVSALSGSVDFGAVVPTNLVEGSEAPKDFVSQVPVEAPITLPAWAQEGIGFRRGEFWNEETCTLYEVINVLGRMGPATEWGPRDFFVDVDAKMARKEIEDNSWTLKRYEMAQRMGTVERVSLQINAPGLPFTNAALAASVGKTIEDFEAVPVSRAAVNVVFDALVESKSGLIEPDLCDKRKSQIVLADGTFNELAFRFGLYKSRAIVVLSWFLLGKGNFVWILVAAQFLHDARPDLFPTPKDLDLFKWFAIV